MKKPDITPLWEMFPNRDPMEVLSATQGVEESVVVVWNEFWGALNSDEKQEYMKVHRPPPGWVEALAFYDQLDEG